MQGDREARNIATTLGREVRTSRRRLRWTQRELGQRVGLEQSRISEIERGFATGTPLIVWVRLGMVLGRPVGMAFARDLRPQPNDAGHLDAQEALLPDLRPDHANWSLRARHASCRPAALGRSRAP